MIRVQTSLQSVHYLYSFWWCMYSFLINLEKMFFWYFFKQNFNFEVDKKTPLPQNRQLNNCEIPKQCENQKN